MFLDIVYQLLVIIFWIPIYITGGFLLFPLYVIQYHFLKKKLIKKYDVNKLNESAKKLEEEYLKDNLN